MNPNEAMSKKTAVNFASQDDAHVRTDTQIKFMYYPLTV